VLWLDRTPWALAARAQGRGHGNENIEAMDLTSITSTRLAAALSLIALAFISVSDFLLTDFWDRNAMVTSVVADILVLIVGVAVVNEFLAARSRRHRRRVADYSLSELSSSCRHFWVTLAEAIGVGHREEISREELRALVQSPPDENAAWMDSPTGLPLMPLPLGG
jgi:hypothetical protein